MSPSSDIPADTLLLDLPAELLEGPSQKEQEYETAASKLDLCAPFNVLRPNTWTRDPAIILFALSVCSCSIFYNVRGFFSRGRRLRVRKFPKFFSPALLDGFLSLCYFNSVIGDGGGSEQTAALTVTTAAAVLERRRRCVGAVAAALSAAAAVGDGGGGSVGGGGGRRGGPTQQRRRFLVFVVTDDLSLAHY